MSRRGEVGATKDNEPFISLFDDNEKLVLKAYLSPDGTQVRIVLPELVELGQIKQVATYENHYVTFHRVPKRRTRR